MRKHVLLGLLACLFVSTTSESRASETICNSIAKEVAGVKETFSISWNTETKSAKVVDDFTGTSSGKVTYVQKHTDAGNKVNIYVRHGKSGKSFQESEYIVFPLFGGFRAIGVNYAIRNGQRFLHSSAIYEDLTCSTI